MSKRIHYLRDMHDVADGLNVMDRRTKINRGRIDVLEKEIKKLKVENSLNAVGFIFSGIALAGLLFGIDNLHKEIKRIKYVMPSPSYSSPYRWKKDYSSYYNSYGPSVDDDSDKEDDDME